MLLIGKRIENGIYKIPLEYIRQKVLVYRRSKETRHTILAKLLNYDMEVFNNISARILHQVDEHSLPVRLDIMY